MRDFTASGSARKSRRLDPIQITGLREGGSVIHDPHYREITIKSKSALKPAGQRDLGQISQRRAGCARARRKMFGTDILDTDGDFRREQMAITLHRPCRLL